MAVTSGFFNSINHDRLYDAEQLSSIFDGIIIDGVYENYGNALKVEAYTESPGAIIVKSGRAWFDTTWTLNDGDLLLTLTAPNQAFDRIDMVVLDIDRRTESRKNTIKIVDGTPSSFPSKPALIKDVDHKQYPLAYITRPSGDVLETVNPINIENAVGLSECPIVTSVLESQNLENLYSQLSSEFNSWWDGIKDTLDENAVTKLQNELTELKEYVMNDARPSGLLPKKIIDKYDSSNYSFPDYKVSTYAKAFPLYDVTIEDTTLNGMGIRDDLSSAFVLPDGYGFVLGYKNTGSERYSHYLGTSLYFPTGSNRGPNNNLRLFYYFSNLDRVDTKTVYEYTGENSIYSTDFGGSWFPGQTVYVAPSVFDVHVDSYPATMKIAYELVYPREQSDTELGVWVRVIVDKLVISSDHVVSHQINSYTSAKQNYTFTTTLGDGPILPLAGVYSFEYDRVISSYAKHADFTINGMVICDGYLSDRSHTPILAIVYKCNRDNVITLGSYNFYDSDYRATADYDDYTSETDSFLNQTLVISSRTGGAYCLIGVMGPAGADYPRWIEITSDLKYIPHMDSFLESDYYTSNDTSLKYSKALDVIKIEGSKCSKVSISSGTNEGAQSETIVSNSLRCGGDMSKDPTNSLTVFSSISSGNDDIIEIADPTNKIVLLYKIEGYESLYYFITDAKRTSISLDLSTLSSSPASYINTDKIIAFRNIDQKYYYIYFKQS